MSIVGVPPRVPSVVPPWVRFAPLSALDHTSLEMVPEARPLIRNMVPAASITVVYNSRPAHGALDVTRLHVTPAARRRCRTRRHTLRICWCMRGALEVPREYPESTGSHLECPCRERPRLPLRPPQPKDPCSTASTRNETCAAPHEHPLSTLTVRHKVYSRCSCSTYTHTCM
jgi:hypothetical protein